MIVHRDSIYAAWVVACNGRVCILLMAEVSVPCPLGGIVHASGSYESREHMVSRGPLRGLGKRLECTLYRDCDAAGVSHLNRTRTDSERPAV